jgi:hypothetical protein
MKRPVIADYRSLTFAEAEMLDERDPPMTPLFFAKRLGLLMITPVLAIILIFCAVFG